MKWMLEVWNGGARDYGPSEFWEKVDAHFGNQWECRLKMACDWAGIVYHTTDCEGPSDAIGVFLGLHYQKPVKEITESKDEIRLTLTTGERCEIRRQ